MRLNGFTAALVSSVCFVALATPAHAQQRQFNIPAGSLKSALDAYARQSGRPIIYRVDEVRHARSAGISGLATVDAALATILIKTGFAVRVDSSGAIAIVRSDPNSGEVDAGGASAEDKSADIVVTGSHIRGGTPSAPPQVFSRRQIEEQGFRDLGELARSIPQNFNGGQNPTVAGGGNQGSGNENSSSSSALNLRGLGPAATLTLLNGHRLAYDTVNQGVDLSQIPVSAIDRIEIVTDGSSALYGSDAVGGVANIVLRRDYDGLIASARLGGSTDGGNTQQQYDMVTGSRWASGGVMVAASYTDLTAITARQRDYTQSLNRTSTLVPSQQQYSAISAAHQKLTDNLTLELDGQFNRRTSKRAAPSLTTADVQINGLLAQPTVTSATGNAALRWDIGRSWQLSASGTYGISNNHIFSRRYSGGAESLRIFLNYDNSVATGELSAEGPLFTLPGGQARLALGGGYRNSNLNVLIRQVSGITTNTTSNIRSRRDVYYGYGELSLPFVGDANGKPFLEQLLVDLAARYESYPDSASLLTPKVGFVYSPDKAITLRANWGKSFKVQTLFQQYQARQGTLAPAAFFLSPPTALPVLLLAGGNPNLGPERADTWSIGGTLKPRQVPGLTIEVTYFNVLYRDRVVSPLTSIADIYTNPLFRDYVTLSPSAATVSAIVATLPQGLSNITGAAFNPAAVGAIADASFQNAAREHLQGIDIAARYRIALSTISDLQFDATASYLENNRQLSPGRPLLPLAGTIFNPPHWRGRLGSTWHQGNFTLSGFGTYIGGTRDTRYAPSERVGSFTTFDLVAQIRSNDRTGALSGVVFGASILNLFNAEPATIRNSFAVDPSYDSTNYPVAGRVVAMTLSKAF